MNIEYSGVVLNWLKVYESRLLFWSQSLQACFSSEEVVSSLISGAGVDFGSAFSSLISIGSGFFGSAFSSLISIGSGFFGSTFSSLISIGSGFAGSILSS